MIIDAHAHVYLDPRIRCFWSQDKSTFMSARDQVKFMDRLGIDRAVILPLNNAETPTEPQSMGELLALDRRYPGRFILFCNPDPRLPLNPDLVTVDRYDYLLRQYRDLGCKGVGELTARLPFDHPLMSLYFEACAQVDFPVVFHTITPEYNTYGVIDDIGLPRLEQVLRRFPRLRLIGHSAAFWSEISGGIRDEQEKNGYPTGPVKPGGTVPRLLRAYPNLYADISANSGFNALTRDENFGYEFIDEFQDRLLFGLDVCSNSDSPPHLSWLQRSLRQGRVTASAYEKITWKNCSRMLNLGL